MNQAFDCESPISKLRRDVAEARQKVEAVDAASKYLEEALSKKNAKLAKVKADWAWEKKKVE